VFAKIICEPISFKSSGFIVFTEPFVPTGMKTGVFIVPCSVVKVAVREGPLVDSLVILNSNMGVSYSIR